MSNCNFSVAFPILSIQLPDPVYQLNGICDLCRVYLKLILSFCLNEGISGKMSPVFLNMDPLTKIN